MDPPGERRDRLPRANAPAAGNCRESRRRLSQLVAANARAPRRSRSLVKLAFRRLPGAAAAARPANPAGRGCVAAENHAPDSPATDVDRSDDDDLVALGGADCPQSRLAGPLS